jgi:hypothetical protein
MMVSGSVARCSVGSNNDTLCCRAFSRLGYFDKENLSTRRLISVLSFSHTPFLNFYVVQREVVICIQFLDVLL